MDSKTLGNDFAPSLDFANMDGLHQAEIGIYNDLVRLLDKYIAGEVKAWSVTDQFEHWMEHTREHFTHENNLMERSEFPNRLVHIGEHELALQMMSQVLDLWIRKQDAERMKYYLFSLWPDWFRRHVDHMDRVLARHVRKRQG